MVIFNYLLYYGLIIPISLLPFRVLYVISDGLYYVIYYAVGYRKKVVLENIHNSFPEKSEADCRLIAKKFYRHFCDLLLESLKVFTISRKEVNNRMVVKDREIMDKYFSENRSVIMAGGHYNNWELFAVAIAAGIQHKAIAIYKPLTNHFFDFKMQTTRGRFGLRMISTKTVKDVFAEGSEKPTATIFGIDQSPPRADRCHWMKFLNQDTGVLFGAEKYAIAYNYPVVFCHITKLKRGHYSISFFDGCEHPQQAAHGEITEKITTMLEREIIREPAYWLWSHKRWKQKRPVESLTLTAPWK